MAKCISVDNIKLNPKWSQSTPVRVLVPMSWHGSLCGLHRQCSIVCPVHGSALRRQTAFTSTGCSGAAVIREPC